MTADPTEAFNCNSSADRLLSWREVRTLAGISRTTAWRLQNTGEFPRPVMISPGRVGWRESDVADWKAALAPRPRGAPGRPRRAEPAPATEPAAAAPATTRAEEPAPIGPRTRSRRAAPGQLSFDF